MVDVMDQIVGREGPLDVIIARSLEVAQEYGNVLGKLLTPRKLPTLQAAYSRVREDVLSNTFWHPLTRFRLC